MKFGKRIAAFALAGLPLAGLPLTAGAVSCTVTAGQAAFGNYDPMAVTPLDGSGLITVECQGDTLVEMSSWTQPVSVQMNTGFSPSFQPRTMVNAGNDLQYNLYTDASRILIWGDGTSGTQVVSDNLSGGSLLGLPNIDSNNYTVYGRIFGGQSLPTGVYSDAVIVTVQYF